MLEKLTFSASTLFVGDSIFIDDEENIRLGDFGLATSNRPSTKPHRLETDAEAIDDISGLMGTMMSSSAANRVSNNTVSMSMNSITGGVGTT